MTERALALLVFMSPACVVTGNAGALSTSESSTGSTTGIAATTSQDDDSSGTTLKLDVLTPDVAAVECVSIEQTTTIVERPSDIILIADDSVDREFVRDIVTNLLPAMTTEGVFDANVVLVVSGPPPPDTGKKFECGAWACRGASSFESFLVVDHPVPAGALLSELLESRDAWSAGLRDESWKHIWVIATTEGDDTLGPQAFLDQLEFEGTGFAVHAVVSATGSGDAEGFRGLTERTGGVYSQGDFVLDEFIDPMIDRIRSTALACEYDIPPAPDGQVFERDKVNVDYDDGFGLQVVGFVESVDDCAGVANGWYYDDAVDPERIVMCPDTCARFEALQEARIEIRFGCATIPAG